MAGEPVVLAWLASSGWHPLRQDRSRRRFVGTPLAFVWCVRLECGP